MLLDGVLSAAASGLGAVSRQLATVSQNVTNANTPGYTRESLAVESVTAGGDGMGVRAGVATRDLDTALQADLFASGGVVADGEARQSALAAIDAASGTPGSGQDLASLVGALRDSFSTLANDPSNQTQQREVVNKASDLAQGINAIGQAISATRQGVQDGLVDDVAQANAALNAVGLLSDQVIAARAQGESTADLEDKRDAAEQTVTQLTGARFLPQDNGDVLAVSGGTVLPLRSPTGPLAIAAASLGPDTPAAVIPALTVSGNPAPVAGGRIGAELDLRDTVLPGLQSSLDDFAQALANGFSAAGLTLFSDPSGSIPAAGTPGFAQVIQAAPAVIAMPSAVRDGAAAPTTAGNTALIDTVLSGVLATGSGTVAGQASALVAANAGLAASAAQHAATNEAVMTALQTRLAASTAVSVDSELTTMVRLQNSYGANAKMITAIQSMFTQLSQAIQ